MRNVYVYNGKIIPEYKIQKVKLLEDVNDLKKIIKNDKELEIDITDIFQNVNKSEQIEEIKYYLNDRNYLVEEDEIIKKFIKEKQNENI